MVRYTVRGFGCFDEARKRQFALAITKLHARKFTVPSLYIHVTFSLGLEGDSGTEYIVRGGVPFNGTVGNIIVVEDVALGEFRTIEMYNELCWEIKKAWDDIVCKGRPRAWFEKKHLWGVIMTGVTALEKGLIAPQPGEEGHWLRTNWAVIKKGAEDRDPALKFLWDEIRERNDLQSLMSSQQEEASVDAPPGYGERA